MVLSSPHGWEYCHHIFSLYFIPILFLNISPMESGIMIWKGTQVLLEVKLNTRNPPFPQLVFQCKDTSFCLELSCLLLVYRSPRASAQTRMPRDYLGSPGAADTEQYETCRGAAGAHQCLYYGADRAAPSPSSARPRSGVCVWKGILTGLPEKMKEAAGAGTVDGLMCRNKLYGRGKAAVNLLRTALHRLWRQQQALDGGCTWASRGNRGLQLCLFSLPGKGPPFPGSAEAIVFGTRRQYLQFSGGELTQATRVLWGSLWGWKLSS